MNIKIEHGFLYVSDEDRETLKQEFDKLLTIEAQYGFWQEKFGLNYSLNYKSNIQENTFGEFLIKPQSKDGIEELNRRVYNDWLELVPYFNEKSEIAKLLEEFELDIKRAPNKEHYIDYVIGKIDNYVLDQGKSKEVGGFFKSGKIRLPGNKTFTDSYEGYLKFKIDFDWGESVYSAYEIKDKLEGVECAKYRIYVSEYLKRKTTKKGVEIELTDAQKVLLLHHLGFCSDLDDTLKSKIYHQFIPELTPDSIRTRFSRINEHYNKKSKDALIEFYQSINYNEKAYELMPQIISVH